MRLNGSGLASNVTLVFFCAQVFWVPPSFSRVLTEAGDPVDASASEDLADSKDFEAGAEEHAGQIIEPRYGDGGPQGTDEATGLDPANEPEAPTGGAYMSAATGEASYAVPLTLPEGRAGMTPSVGLSYASGGGNGLVGRGWGMPRPMVQRYGAMYGTPDYYKEAYEYNAEPDIYVISSPVANGRLVPVDSEGTLWQTEHDSFTKIVRNTNENKWVVKTPNGHEYVFGLTEAFGRWPTEALNFQNTHSWCLYQIKDTVSEENTITYDWYELHYPAPININAHYPVINTIEYSGLKVSFHYEERADVRPDYSAGYMRMIPQRLKSIYIKPTTSPDITLGGLRLRYNDPDLAPLEPSETVYTHSYLTQVQPFGTSGEEYTAGIVPWFFTYTQRGCADTVGGCWDWASEDWLDNHEHYLPVPFVDSVGLFDLGIRTGDFNGDGLLDFVVSRNQQGEGAEESPLDRQIYLNRGINDDPAKGWSRGWDLYEVPDLEVAFSRKIVNQGNVSWEPIRAEIADFDGDGDDDFFVSRKPGLYLPLERFVQKVEFTGNEFTFTKMDLDNVPLASSYGHRSDLGLRLADFNGDGLPDFAKYCNVKDYADQSSPSWGPTTENRCDTNDLPSGLYLNISDGTTWGYVGDFTAGNLKQAKPFYNMYGSSSLFYVSFNDYYPRYGTNSASIRSTGITLTDINGDGLPDMLYPKDSHLGNQVTQTLGNDASGNPTPGRLYLGAGNPYHPDKLFNDGNADHISGIRQAFDLARTCSDANRLTDINGDGYADYLSQFKNESNDIVSGAYLNRGRLFNNAFTDDLGWETTIHTGYQLPQYLKITDLNPGPGMSTDDYGVRLMDINHDGLVDLAMSDGWDDGDLTYSALFFGQGRYPGLLEKIRTPKGATISFDYLPSVDRDVHIWDENKPQLAQLKRLVRSVTVNDGRTETPSVTEFRYYRGVQAYNRDAHERRFRGFRQVQAKTNPTAHASDNVTHTTDTWFHVDDAVLAGKSEIIVASIDGCALTDSPAPLTDCSKVLSITTNEYDTDLRDSSAPPYFVPLKKTETEIFETDWDTAISMHSETRYLYENERGVLLEQVNLGDDNPHPTHIKHTYANKNTGNPAFNHLVLECKTEIRQLFNDDLNDPFSADDRPTSENMLEYTRYHHVNGMDCEMRGEGPALIKGVVRYGGDDSETPVPPRENWRLATWTTYDAWGNPICVRPSKHDTECEGELTTRTQYDDTYHLLPRRVTTADGLYTETTYDDHLRTKTVTSPTGVITTTVYDHLNRPLKVKVDDVSVAIIDYHNNVQGLPIAQHVETRVLVQDINAVGETVDNWKVKKDFFDGLGRTYYTESSFTNDTTANTPICSGVEFDLAGRVVFSSLPAVGLEKCDYQGVVPMFSPRGHYGTETIYDKKGRVRSVLAPDGTKSVYAYNFINSSIELPAEFPDMTMTASTTVDARGWGYMSEDYARTSVTDLTERLRWVIENNDAEQYFTSYDYDARGNLIMFMDNELNDSQFGFTPLSEKEWVQDMDQSNCVESADCLWQYAYNKFGEIAFQTDAKGQVVQSVYDAVGRLTCSRVIEEGHAEVESATECDCYYPANNEPDASSFIDMRDVCMFYDGTQNSSDAGQLVRRVDESGVTTLARDEFGNVAVKERRICLPLNIDSETGGPANVQCSTSRVEGTYDRGGLLLATDFDDGTLTLIYNYDSRGRMTSVNAGNVSVAVAAYNDEQGLGELERYTVDTDFTDQTSPVLETDLAYHDFDQANWEVDRSGPSFRLKSKTVSQDGQTLQKLEYATYDEIGNIEVFKESYQDQEVLVTDVWRHTYDELTRLTQTLLDKGNTGVNEETIVYEYDAIGNRTRVIHTMNDITEGRSPIVPPVELSGDLTLDQKINVSDYIPFGRAWGLSDIFKTPWADLTYNQELGITDFLEFGSQYGAFGNMPSGVSDACHEQNLIHFACSRYLESQGVNCAAVAPECTDLNLQEGVREVEYLYGLDLMDGFAGPHAVAADTLGNLYRYDENGNIVRYGQRYIEYDARNRIKRLRRGMELAAVLVYDGGDVKAGEVRYDHCIPFYGNDPSNNCTETGIRENGIVRNFFPEYQERVDVDGTVTRVVTISVGGSKVMEIPVTVQ